MYPKTGQRGADVTQTAMLRALSLNVSPIAEGMCWRGWMWAVSDSLQDPSACQVGKAMPAYTSARSGFTPWWLTTQSRIDMVGVGILHVLLKTIYIFTVPFFELSFCYSVNVWAWTMLETPFRYCFHLTALYIYFESKGSPASESLCCFLILCRQKRGASG